MRLLYSLDLKSDPQRNNDGIACTCETPLRLARSFTTCTASAATPQKRTVPPASQSSISKEALPKGAHNRLLTVARLLELPVRCFDTCLHRIDPRMKSVHQVLDDEATIAGCCNGLQGGVASTSQEGVCDRGLAGQICRIHDALDNIARDLVCGMLENMWHELLHTRLLPCAGAMLENARHDEVPKRVPGESLAVLQQLVQEKSDLVLAGILDQAFQDATSKLVSCDRRGLPSHDLSDAHQLLGGHGRDDLGDDMVGVRRLEELFRALCICQQQLNDPLALPDRRDVDNLLNQAAATLRERQCPHNRQRPLNNFCHSTASNSSTI